MGSILLQTAGGVTLNGTLANGTKITLEYIDLGPNVMEQAFIEPFTNDIPVMTATVDRKTSMQLQFFLEGTSVANMIADAELVRNEFRVANTLSWSPDSPGVATRTIPTFPSPTPPLVSTDDDLRRLTKQLLVFDWHLEILRPPFFTGQSAPPMA